MTMRGIFHDLRRIFPRPLRRAHARTVFSWNVARRRALLAAGIPDAEFVTLASDNHILLGREPASIAFGSQLRDFFERASKPMVG